MELLLITNAISLVIGGGIGIVAMALMSVGSMSDDINLGDDQYVE